MAGFKFRLEQVLEYRRRLEEAAMQDLARAQDSLNKVLARRDSLLAEIADNNAKLSKGAALTGAERWLLLSYDGALKSEVKSCEERIRILQIEVDRCREEVIAKSQERQLLEKLKEKQFAAYNKAEKQKEQKEYDETATLRYQPKAI